MAARGLALFSGGLDSSLAIKLAQAAGLEVVALFFAAPFISSARKRGPRRAAERLGVELIVKSIGLDYIDLLRRPRFGFGKNLNPCVHCKIYMYSRAKAIMDELGFDVLITGEVLGQRPMTQIRHVLKLMEREAGLEGRVLRPLSAKLLDPTDIELEGRIRREALGAIHGRSRKPQMELAKRLGLSGYATPAGGCLLTDPAFARRLSDLLNNTDRPTFREMNLLRYGRHFRLDSSKVIIGRNERENRRLEQRRSWAQAYLRPVGFAAPVALMFGAPTDDEVIWAARALARYGRRAGGVEVSLLRAGRERRIVVDEPLSDEELKRRII